MNPNHGIFSPTRSTNDLAAPETYMDFMDHNPAHLDMRYFSDASESHARTASVPSLGSCSPLGIGQALYAPMDEMSPLFLDDIIPELHHSDLDSSQAIHTAPQPRTDAPCEQKGQKTPVLDARIHRIMHRLEKQEYYDDMEKADLLTSLRRLQSAKVRRNRKVRAQTTQPDAR
eukprot:CAMPEP_0184696788 /NCGR_PEP_ID=MMETSP0313-20130426/3976_1 /TAXON_ID=2792 /ORGANISM="Porphyridium aerugineum, Strain SAG 1380-2" /LENGTH=172 /DNA_ID=CAMNT_0027155487 /DNA_START=57 /DNA_END=575 /DNA_ORIENTATION=-